VTARRLAALVLAAAVVGGCSSDEAPSPGAAAPTTTATPTTVAAPLDPAGLEPLVVGDAPAGFALADDAVGGTGPTDLAEAAGDNPDGGEVLAEAGFVRGWQRLWVSDDGEDELLLLLYELATPQGAADLLARIAAGPAEGGGEGVFEVPAIPGAVGVSGGGGGLEVNAVVYASGPYLVQVIGNGPEPGPSQGTVTALAAAQAQRLA
jgi:hypothetical protein